MMLGVSRQSVTKWESERSYPEMDKLLKLCSVFDCTLDELVQGDLTGRASDPTASVAPSAPPADVFGYDEFMRRFANRISGGVMAIILGVALSLLLFGLSEPAVTGLPVLGENASAALGIMAILGGVAVGLALIIPASLAHSQFVREHPFLEDFYTAEQKAKARSTFSMELIGGIVAIFCGVCLCVLFSDTAFENLVGTPAMLACIAVGVRFIIHGSMALGRTNIAEYNHTAAEVLEAHEIAQAPISPEQKQELMRQHRADKRIGAVCGIIMLLATAIALLMLFGGYAAGVDDYSRGLVSLFWLPWPIGGLLCGIAALTIKGFAKPEE